METAVSQVRGGRTVLHSVNDLPDVCDLNHLGMAQTDELNGASIAADGYDTAFFR